MWAIRYSDEVKYYFLDNGDLVFDLLVKIEELRLTLEGIPPEGTTQLEPNFFAWEILRHVVIYERQDKVLVIEVVKPKE